MEDDDQLYERFLAGDTVAFDMLVSRHKDRLILFIFGYLHNWHDSEDLMIDAFARIMVKRPAIRPGGFKGYLYKTARNLTIRYHEKRCKLRAFSLDEMGLYVADKVLVEDVIHGVERINVLHRCLSRIDSQLREVLWLVYVEGMKYAQAACVLGVNAKRVDHLLDRAKRQMREELSKEGVTDAS